MCKAIRGNCRNHISLKALITAFRPYIPGPRTKGVTGNLDLLVKGINQEYQASQSISNILLYISPTFLLSRSAVEFAGLEKTGFGTASLKLKILIAFRFFSAQHEHI